MNSSMFGVDFLWYQSGSCQFYSMKFLLYPPMPYFQKFEQRVTVGSVTRKISETPCVFTIFSN